MSFFSKQVDKRISAYQQELIATHYAEVENMYQKMRGWRHDYRNHIQAMKAFAAVGDLATICEYLEKLDCDLSTVDTVIKTGNKMMDAIIGSKISLAHAHNIPVRADADIPVSLTTSEIDLCVIIGNLFDNAIEASLALPEEKRMIRQERFMKKYSADKTGPFYSNGLFARYAARMGGFYNASSAAVSVAFTGVVYAFVCLKAWAGAFAIGEVTQYIASITKVSTGVSMLVRVVGDLRNNVPFLKENFRFLDIPNTMYQGSLTVEKRKDCNYEVEFKDVSFRYPGSDVWALRNINMKFRIGKRLAVVGRNGSGKTTFIKLLCRLYDPTEGEILLNGINIRKYNYLDYMSIFSVVFQDFKLFAFSLGQNVAAGVDYDKERAETCLIKAGFGERLAMMPEGTETYLYRDFCDNGVDISGGEAQKIAIARAMYKDSPFIVLDEPTAALDPVAEAEIYSKFGEIVEDKTAIYISHRLSSCRFCDDILVFDEGRIVQQGSHDRLVADGGGKYYELWNAQAQYYT